MRAVELLDVGRSDRTTVSDAVAVEEPLAIRIGGVTFAVIMRTPGEDRELAAGFLHAERLIRGRDDISRMQQCADEGSDGAVNVINVSLTDEAALRAALAVASRRHVTTASACGVCGRRSVDDLLASIDRLPGGSTLPRALAAALPESLRDAQAVFDRTGGLHAAGLFRPDGTLVSAAEDIGRHNAVDKVIGGQLLDGRLPLSDRILVVSGRTSFEIVQKAVVAGIPVVAAVSAPSSLAVSLARESNLTLLGFVRDGAFNIYAGPQRIID